MGLIFGIDEVIFYSINHLTHTVFFDEFARFLSGLGRWGAIWFVIAIVLFFREERRHHLFFLPVILATSLATVCSEFLLKGLIGRPRPSIEMGAIIVDRADYFSFPSTHATLAFALAYVLSVQEPKLTYWLYALATLIAISRVYLGAHFPSDVLFGGLLGYVIGYATITIGKKLHPKKNRTGKLYRNAQGA